MYQVLPLNRCWIVPRADHTRTRRHELDRESVILVGQLRRWCWPHVSELNYVDYFHLSWQTMTSAIVQLPNLSRLTSHIILIKYTSLDTALVIVDDTPVPAKDLSLFKTLVQWYTLLYVICLTAADPLAVTLSTSNSCPTLKDSFQSVTDMRHMRDV